MSLRIDLSDRAVIVTGGTSGIGAAAVEVCLNAGARVAFCARHAPKASSPAFAIAADVSVTKDVARVFDEAEDRLGPVTGVIHAAAVLGPIGTVCDVDPSDWLRTLEIDLYGSFLVVREACRRMRLRDGGRIALFSGGGASKALPNYTAYACSKAGVVRFAETVALEMKPYGIEINSIAPGFVATPMHQGTLRAGAAAAGQEYFELTVRQLEEGGVPAEIGARAAAFLISDAARGITGKFVSAVHDDLASLPQHLAELRGSEIFTLRRVLPAARGMNWQ